jgi:hypothetical protein
MKPVRIFLFFAAVLALLWVIALMVPEEGISLGSEIRLHFVSLTELFKEDTLHRDANVARLLAHSSVTEDPESEPEEGLFLLPDTSVEERVPAVIPVNTDSLQKSVYRLAFPEEGEGMLDPFFRKLEGLRKGTTDRTRILHFGDSQIENDRMSALIRFRLTGCSARPRSRANPHPRRMRRCSGWTKQSLRIPNRPRLSCSGVGFTD